MVGILYVVATPIGNLSDISQRALDTLSEVAVIAAEDTRHSKKLLQHFAINTPLISLYAQNEKQRTQEIITRLKAGEDVAVISDAGTPLVSDPGGQLVRMAHQEQIKVVPIPGVCAAIAALSAAGLPADSFIFVGFLSNKAGPRCRQLAEFLTELRTVVCYEAPHRILALLNDIRMELGSERILTVARELTKAFETIKRGTAAELIQWMEADSNQQKGEFVVLIQGVETQHTGLDAEALRVMQLLASELPLKQAAQLAAKITGLKKNVLYQWALEQGVSRP